METDGLIDIEASGNRFTVVDGFAAGTPANPARLAVELGARGPRHDGLLLLLPPRADGDCRMVVFNADGTRPEACGNGLLCVARLAVERGHARGPVVRVETDAGPRRVEISRTEKGVVARAALGAPRIAELETRLPGAPHPVSLVDLGNPHCVLLVTDVESAPLARVGPWLERHPRFPDGTNVELVEAAASALRVRTWERGVGETAACGTGACAAAVVAVTLGRARSPVEVRMRGGTLRVHWEGGTVEVEGRVGEPVSLEVEA